MEIDPKNATAHYNLGTLMAVRGQMDRAIAEFETAVRLMPDYADAYYALGLAFKREGKVQSAEEAFRSAQRLDPRFKLPVN